MLAKNEIILYNTNVFHLVHIILKAVTFIGLLSV